MSKPPDKLLFEMPDSLEDFLFCCLIVQELQMSLLARGVKSDVTVKCKASFEPVGAPSLYPAKIVREFSPEDLASADMVTRFDRDRAMAIGGKSSKHVTESYGILSGAASVTVPVLGERLPIPANGPEVLWLPRHNSDWRAMDAVWDGLPEFLGMDTSFQALDAHIEPERAWEAISGASVCAGIAGGLTALAAALGKPLIEVLPPRLFHANWVAKWGSPDYRVLTLNPEDLTVETVWKSISDLAEAIDERNLQWGYRQPTISLPKSVAA